MEAVRAFAQVENGCIFIRLPEEFASQQVEVIVLPISKTETSVVLPVAAKRKPSHFRGILRDCPPEQLTAAFNDLRNEWERPL